MFTQDEFKDAVIAGIQKIMLLEEVNIHNDEDFGAFGLDSLQGMNLVLEVEDRLGIDLGEFDLEDANTINLFYKKVKKIIG